MKESSGIKTRRFLHRRVAREVFKQTVPPILVRVFHKLRSLSRKPIKYKILGFPLILSPNHGLPRIQGSHPQYDRFLPHLARYLDPGEIVIDVGANCGDTLVTMFLNNDDLQYVCIEPDETFFRYLRKNADQLEPVGKKEKIKTIKTLIGRQISGVKLEGIDGTKHAVPTDEKNSLKSQPLDEVLKQNNILNPRLIKVDVDGFDYDVIDSAQAVIESCLPIIYAEAEITNLEQRNGFQNTFRQLEVLGYMHWVAFDNFGQVILQTEELSNIEQLLDYVWRQRSSNSTRTIYYFDVLVVTKKDAKFIKQVILDYIS